MFLIVVEDAVTMTTASLQDSTEKNSGSSEPKLILYQGEGRSDAD